MQDIKIPEGRVKLTDELVKRLPFTGKRYEVIDSVIPGFHIRVSQSGKTYSIRYRNVEGIRRRDTIGKHGAVTAEQARKIAKGKAGDVAKGRDPQQEKREKRKRRKGCPTLQTFLEGQYKDWAVNNRRSGAGTVARIKSAFPDLMSKSLDQIIAWNVEKWRAARHKAGISPATTDRDIIALRALMSHAVMAGHIDKNPLSKFRLSKPDNGRIRFLSPQEEKQLRKALEDRENKARERKDRYVMWLQQRGHSLPKDRGQGYSDHLMPLVLLALNTGTRRGELFNLTWDNVDLQRAIMTVEAHTAKTARTRHIPLNLEAVEILRCWRPKSPKGLVFPGKDGNLLGSVKTAWAALMQDAKIEEFTFHDLRHTFASKLVIAGVSLSVVRDLLGHSSIAMTERYAHLTPDMKADAVAKLV